MAFDRVRAAIAFLQGKPLAPAPTPTDAVPTTPAPVATTGGAAVAPVADPIEIRTFDQSGQHVFSVDGLDAAKAQAQWLTKGKDRTQPATATLLKDCTTDHLKAIVLNKPNLSPDYLRIIESILGDRGETMPTPTFDLTVTDDQDDSGTPDGSNRFGL